MEIYKISVLDVLNQSLIRSEQLDDFIYDALNMLGKQMNIMALVCFS